ncbi:achilleol B synthase-like [Lolium rigidum]|uniref:achilleol B synthase-like n=1 Tax=Lolium rigidum TaxID=89674 RepID=UPI001F5D2A78|nr:achilleol B synthase-like [Lolium rigidum]
MWKLKIGGASGPWLRSTSEFLGRQVWEFDPDAGTAEERAEVERMRRDFTEHRFQRKESQDLLLRLQYAKLNSLGVNNPKIKLENITEVTEECISTSLTRALNQWCTLQAHDGHWPGDYSGILFIMPMFIFSLYVTRSLDIVISSEHRREICRHIYNHQNEDGGWGIHVRGPSNMFGSCLNYAALRLLGEMLHGNDALIKGQDWILSHGTATHVPQWGKIFLSILGIYDWSGNNPIIPELWLVPYFLPIHPGRFWCFCRLVYMSMAYLYGKKFVGPITPTILALREELYCGPYENIDWNKARDSCAKEDLHHPHSQAQSIINGCLNRFVEPMLNYWPANKLRERAMSNLMEHIHYNDETTEYITICPVDKALNMICCWVENPNSNAFKQHLPRVYDYLWLAEDGMKAKIYDGCQSWETPFIIQAFCSSNLIEEFGPTIEKAHEFIKKSQVRKNYPSYQSFYRHRSKGSWTLSTIDNGWSVSDCTAESVKALLLLSKILPKHVGDSIEEERLYDAIDCILSFMNKDGSFSTYECKRTYSWLEVLNPSESFQNIVIDHPSAECTASVLDALVLFTELYPMYRKKEIEKCTESAVKFIQSKQQDDGSWYGTWGICFTYGTFFGVKGLAAAGRTYNNSSSIRKACNFLLSKQQSTGGWGESYLSIETEVYVDNGAPHAVDTAWAMLALIYAGQVEIDPAPLHRAALVLMNMQLESGEFPQEEHIGCANSAFYFNYPNYRNVFPIMALGEFRRRLIANQNKDGCN